MTAPAARAATPTAVEALSDHLAAAATATEGLVAWCAARGLGEGPIRVVRLPADACAALGAEAAAALAPDAGETVESRRVELRRGDVALSEAEIWFVPERLPPAVRVALAETDAPFGALIAPLRPRRETTLARVADDGLGAGFVLEHRALVRSGAGRPLAVTRERYRAALVGGAR
jgi:hypothetical protein